MLPEWNAEIDNPAMAEAGRRLFEVLVMPVYWIGLMMWWTVAPPGGKGMSEAVGGLATVAVGAVVATVVAIVAGLIITVVALIGFCIVVGLIIALWRGKK